VNYPKDNVKGAVSPADDRHPPSTGYGGQAKGHRAPKLARVIRENLNIESLTSPPKPGKIGFVFGLIIFLKHGLSG
jgi:hypothetical protein